MKLYTRLIAALLIAALAFTLAGCHKKDETVMTVGEVTIPSGLYLAFQLEGFAELMDGVNAQLEESSAASEITAYADYFNYDYEDKSAVDYIADYAEKMAIEYAVIEAKAAEFELELAKEDVDYVNSYAEYYWENSTGIYYEANGVSLQTYKKLLTHQFKKSMVFNYYYSKPDEDTGKGGLQQVEEKKLIDLLGSDFILADYMSVSLVPSDSSDTTEYTDSQIKGFKSKMDGYADKINKGEAYNNVYKEYTGSAPSPVVTLQEGDPATLSTTATLLSSLDDDTTMYDLFKTVKDKKDFAFGKAYVVGGEADGAYYTVVLHDVSKDAYYLEQTRATLLHELMDETFDTLLADEGKAMTVTKDEGLLKYYSPAKIDYDKAVSEAAQ